ncbi:MAG: hypothetical protein KIT27_08940, partial [Legionellales bacterium]|nr:hypothetical protein [Legionellales bacterium]
MKIFNIMGGCGLLIAVFMTAHAENFNVATGKILDDHDAKIKCPLVCANAHSKWTGQWNNMQGGQLAVCVCDNAASQKKSPALTPSEQAAPENSEDDDFNSDNNLPHEVACHKRNIDAGKIYNNYDAEQSCSRVCAWEGGEWTHHWSSQGQTSFCECTICGN